MLSLRRWCHHTLHQCDGVWGPRINGFLGLIIILSIAIIPLYLISEEAGYRPILFGIELFVAVVFTIDYIFRVWSAAYPVRYIFSWYGIIDLVSFLPFYLQMMGMMSHAEIFLALRILRILKLGKTYHEQRIATANASKIEHGTFKTFKGEVIERVVHRHPIIFLISLVPVLLASSLGFGIFALYPGSKVGIAVSILFLVFSSLFFLKAWLDFHYDVIYITNKRILLQDRQLFGSRINDISYKAITNIKPDSTGMWHFLFGMGNIQIETAASQTNREFNDVIDAVGVVQHISGNRQKMIEHYGEMDETH